MAKHTTPKVALLIETARGYGRGLLRGIVRYSRLHGPWSFYITPGDFEQVLPKMQHWGCTGIIARIATPKVAKAILECGLPTIALDLADEEIQPGNPLSKLCEIVSDSHRAAQMAAEHLLNRKFLHYAFVGTEGRVWSDRRRQSFCEWIAAAGYQPHVYSIPRRSRNRAWDQEQSILVDWLKGLPTPLGMMACNDDCGREVLEACRAANIRVPEQIAMVAVDNDKLLCELSDPPLSSVALDAERGGYQAAELLEKMMQGRIRKPQRLIVAPLHVVTRRSSDIIALEDVEVGAALKFIHERAANPICIEDVVEHVQLSRRALEIRFQKAIGRTIHDELIRVRIERAKRLLLESDLQIPKVAMSVGFNTASYFVQVFSHEVGITPARYRTKMRTT
jgi:LacI family transcriptional regulator